MDTTIATEPSNKEKAIHILRLMLDNDRSLGTRSKRSIVGEAIRYIKYIKEQK